MQKPRESMSIPKHIGTLPKGTFIVGTPFAGSSMNLEVEVKNGMFVTASGNEYAPNRFTHYALAIAPD